MAEEVEPDAKRVEAEVVGLIRGGEFYRRSPDYRDEVCAWLRANSIDPNVVALEDVEVVLIDGPAIARTEIVLDRNRRKQLDRAAGGVVRSRVHSLLRVPLPPHLNDLETRREQTIADALEVDGAR